MASGGASDKQKRPTEVDRYNYLRVFFSSFAKTIKIPYPRLRDMRENLDKFPTEIAKLLNTTQKQYSTLRTACNQTSVCQLCQLEGLKSSGV